MEQRINLAKEFLNECENAYSFTSSIKNLKSSITKYLESHKRQRETLSLYLLEQQQLLPPDALEKIRKSRIKDLNLCSLNKIQKCLKLINIDNTKFHNKFIQKAKRIIDDNDCMQTKKSMLGYFFWFQTQILKYFNIYDEEIYASNSNIQNIEDINNEITILNNNNDDISNDLWRNMQVNVDTEINLNIYYILFLHKQLEIEESCLPDSGFNYQKCQEDFETLQQNT